MLLREFQPVNYELETNGEILWSNKHIFEDPIVIMNDSKSGKQSRSQGKGRYIKIANSIITGTEILSLNAKSNETLEFSCNLPEKVFCATDFMSDGSSRLRVVLSSVKNLTSFDLPISVISKPKNNDSYKVHLLFIRLFIYSFIN